MPAIKVESAAVQRYYAMLDEAARQGQTHEGNIRNAFQELLRDTAKEAKGWELVTEETVRRENNAIRYDGTLRDANRLPHGWWEAKDSGDDLEVEIRKKREKGYRFDNIIFEDTRRAVLFQNNDEVIRVEVRDKAKLVELLNRFYTHEIEPFKKFAEAVSYFQTEIPHIANGLKERIEAAHKDNKKFQTAFDSFMELCKNALNPNISQAAVDEMLIQHMLTIRLIAKIFTEGFTQRNVIASEIETVIGALTSRHFDPKEFLGALDRFYSAIEDAAEKLATYSEKQEFINHVYERFFQGYSVKIADTHGIVYTPQPIVDFMCAAVEEVLLNEFGKKLGDEGVYVIDPATGTGNFAINLLRRAYASNPRNFEQFYRHHLFANEVMLMPYYIASLNIEHEYYELTQKYEPFDGICFVDTLDLAEGAQMKLSFMTERNTERVERQKKTPITVIIGNPPYNVGQLNENDNNKNRKYDVIDQRVRETYAKDSKASSKSKLNDPYVKFFRWASDRLQGRDGVVCFVSNSSFIEKPVFDGMRKNLLKDFSKIFVLDLKGDIRKDSMRDGIPLGEKHTVFGLAAMVGISITVLVRNQSHIENKLLYSAVDWRSTREEKFDFLRNHVALDTSHNALNTIEWNGLKPDKNNTWLVPENADKFDAFMPMGGKEAKTAKSDDVETIFKIYSLGLNTNRDNWAYNFDKNYLSKKITETIDVYNSEIDRWRRAKKPKNIDDFVITDETKIKWSSRLKETFSREKFAEFDVAKIRTSIYRPYSKQFAFFDKIFNQRQGMLPYIFPTLTTEQENSVICVVNEEQIPFSTQIINCIPALHYGGRQTQCFPFYTYDEDGTNRRENITDWALAQFRTQYKDEGISKWDIFYYVYALLHHPTYRTKFADNLKRELPRIPFAADFWAFAEAGKKLADLHLNYETVKPYALDWITTAGKPINYRVEKMKFTKENDLVYNDTLTLKGIPKEAFDYKLGNRSALHWIVDQYQVSTDKRSGITSDPNTYSDDERYIVNLVERVTRVSVETVAIVNGLPGLP